MSRGRKVRRACNVIRTCSTGRWTTPSATVQVHPLLRSVCNGGRQRWQSPGGEPARCRYSTNTGADTDSAEHRAGGRYKPPWDRNVTAHRCWKAAGSRGSWEMPKSLTDAWTRAWASWHRSRCGRSHARSLAPTRSPWRCLGVWMSGCSSLRTTRRRGATAEPYWGNRSLRGGGWARQPAPPVAGLGLKAMQGLTNTMNAITNQVIRNSGRATRNAAWPYFDGTYRDSPAFKRKFASFQQLAKGKSLGRSKPATKSQIQALATHCVDYFYYIQALLNCLL